MKKLLLLLLLIAGTIQAENFHVPLVKKPVVIDGVLDDGIWVDALQINLKYEIDPGTNLPAVIDTIAYVVDSGQSIVFAFKASDPDPERIRAFLRDRDASYQDDYVGVILDTYNDELRALEFYVNPLGAQIDLIRSGNRIDDSWDAIWDSAGKINDDGYIVEIEIPYNELQMPKTEGEKTWGISFSRSYPRNVSMQIRDTTLDRNNTCFLCQINKFTGFANAQRGKDLEITPSITTISRQGREDLTGGFSDVEHMVEPSLDINWGINSNLTLNATINPDFSQVESDSAQLDVNQTFALFFPERRPFFLENSDYFRSNMNLIHTRNIANPDYGIRFVGKSDKNAYGFFYTDDTITNILIPGVFGSGLASLEQESENLAARYRRDFGNSSTFGGLVTRRSSQGDNNAVVSLDTSYRISNEDTLSLQYTHSSTLNPETLIDDYSLDKNTSGNAYKIVYRHNDEKWFYQVRHISYDDDFRADLGFIRQVGFEKSVVSGQRTWRTDDQNKWWTRISASSGWNTSHDQAGRLLEKVLRINLNINAMKQSFMGINAQKRQRLWDDILFDETRLGFDVSFQPKAGWELGTGFAVGDSIDFSNSKIANRTGAYVFAGLNLGQHLSMNLNHSFRKLNRDGGNVFVANQTDLRFSYQFDIRQRLRLSVINTNINRDTSLYDFDIDSHSRRLSNQLIYSYKVNPKTLLFFGYSDGGREDQNIDLTTTNRTFFAKFSYAWKL